MVTAQLSASSISGRNSPPFEGFRPSTVKVSSVAPLRQTGLSLRSFRDLVVKAATTVAHKYTTLKPLGDRVLVKIKTAEEKTVGGILLPTSTQSKPQGSEVVAVARG
ncbi:20 kDa chaperonin, chloroplastic [Sarracenia purpurea var. burkii]